MLKYNILAFFIVYLCFHVNAQIQINESFTPQQLVQNYFIGGGVTVTNVQFHGALTSTGASCNQIAYFSNGNSTSLGMDAGIVITTGCVNNVPQNGSAFMSNDLGLSGVPELTSLAGAQTYDGAVLEFDFIPLDNQVSFTYIFGSEEYPEFVNAGYNDIFTFFITGPNPGGGNYTNQNIALIPSTSTPVSIDNVNAGSYSQYFVNNDGSSNQPVFDGFTTPLNAVADVVPCQTYHLKICIADAGDGIYDSGVFLKRNSLSTDAIDLVVSYSSGSAPAGEGCSTATVTATIGNAPSSPVTVNYTIGGTASNADFTQPIPTSITIPAGQTSASFTLNPVIDGLTEGTEYVVFSMPSGCGGFSYDTVYVADNSVLSVNAGQDQTLCASAMPATLTATPTGGVAPYSYSWNNGAGNSQTVSVSPATTTHYQVTVTDACGQSATDVVDVIVIPNPTSTFTANTPICAGDVVNVQYTGNASAAATYNWDFNGATIISGGTGQGPHQITWNTAGTYTISLSVTEGGCNSSPSQQQVVVYDLGSSYCCTMPTPNAGPDKTICGLSTSLEAINSMAGTWTSVPATATISQPTNPHSTVTVPNEGTYQFIWTESTSAFCTNRDTVVITFIQTPVVNSGSGGMVCTHSYTFSATTNIGVGTWTANPSVGVTFTDIHNPNATATVTNDGVYTFTWTVDNNGCVSSSQNQVSFYEQPVAFAGNDDAVCSLTYNLQGSTNAGVGTWTGVGPGTISFSGGVNNPTATVTVSNTGQYTLVWTVDNHGCTDADTVSLLLTQVPTSTFTVDTINCSGQTTMVTYTGQSASNAIYTWTWDGGNAIPGTGAGPHVVNWSSTGIHNISLTVSVNGCTSTNTSINILNPTPLMSSIVKTDLLCYGTANGKVDLTVTGGRLPYSFQWNNGAPTEDLLNIPAGIYTVTVTDASGCTKTDGITINQPAQLVASVTPTQYICIGQPAYLSITATGGTPSYQYFWNGQSSNPSIAVYPEVTTTYTASVVDANGCSSSLLSTTVYVAPPLHVNLLANTDHVCPGDPVMLTPVIWGGVGPPYIIYNQDGDVVTPPIYIYPNQSGWYGVRVEDACGSWDTSSVFIHVWPLPPASILADTMQGCVPLTVHFIEVNPDSGQTYLWDFGDQSNLSLSKNPVHTYTTSGTFDVTITVTSNHGCKTTVVYNDMITVWPKPNAAYVWSPEVVTEIKPVLNFTNMSTGAAWYQWMFGDGDSSSVVNPEHRYPGKGDYETQLVAVSNKGCTDTAKAIIKILEQYTFYAPTAFSPDGDRNNDFFYVVAHGIKEEGFYLEVYDRWGEIIWSTKQYSKMDERSEKWDGRAKNHEIVPIGTYTWRAVFRDNFDKLHEETGAVTIVR